MGFGFRFSVLGFRISVFLFSVSRFHASGFGSGVSAVGRGVEGAPHGRPNRHVDNRPGQPLLVQGFGFRVQICP